MFNFVVDNVHELRIATFARKERQVRKYILSQLSNCQRLSHATLAYTIAGIKVCREAWEWAHGFSPANSGRVHAEFNKWFERANPSMDANDKDAMRKAENGFVGLSSRQVTCEIWVLDWVTAVLHNPANLERKGAQMSDIAPRSLYDQYTKWCQNVDGKGREEPIAASKFRAIFIKTRSDLQVKMRSSKQGSSQDPIISEIKRLRAKTVRNSDKKLLDDATAIHVAFHKKEHQLYESRIFAAKDVRGTVSMIIDKADQSAHDIPKCAGRQPKDIQTWSQSVLGVLIHGRAFHAFNIPEFVKSGANLTLTALMRSLQILMQHEPDLVIEVLYLQMDGAGENWAKAVFGTGDLLFDVYPELKEITFTRFGVANTHCDIDRNFGYFNQEIYGTGPRGKNSGVDIITREDFAHAFHRAMSDKKDTMYLRTVVEDLPATFDFWDFLTPHFDDSFSGYGSAGEVRVVRLQRRPGSKIPHISYKYWSQDEKWHPSDGSSIKILKHRPSLEKPIKTSPAEESASQKSAQRQKGVLRWLVEQQQGELVTAEQVLSWRNYFSGLTPYVKDNPSAPFTWGFPHRTLPDSVAQPSKPKVQLGVDGPRAVQRLEQKILRLQRGPAIEPVTHPDYSRAVKKRKRDALNVASSHKVKIQKGFFVFVNCPIDDDSYQLSLALGKVRSSSPHKVDLSWWIYRGYPESVPDSHKGPWQRQIKEGKGQVQDIGTCRPDQVVLSFEKLNKNNTIPRKIMKLLAQLTECASLVPAGPAEGQIGIKKLLLFVIAVHIHW